jgi:hypothetical protein
VTSCAPFPATARLFLRPVTGPTVNLSPLYAAYLTSPIAFLTGGWLYRRLIHPPGQALADRYAPHCRERLWSYGLV